MRILRRVSIMAFLLVCLGAAHGQAQQGDVDRYNDDIRGANRRLAEIEKLFDTNDGDRLRSETGRKIVRNRIGAKREIANALDREIRQITAEINADTRQTRRLDSTLAALKTEYGKLIRSAWTSQKMNTTAAFLLSSRDFNDATRRISYIRRYNRARAQKGVQIDSLNRSLQAGIEKLAARKAELGVLKNESDSIISSLAKDEKRYETALRTLRANRQKLEADARKERHKIAAAQRQIDRIMAEQARAGKAGLSQAEIALSGRFDDNRGRLPWPVGGPGTLVDRFGIERMADGIQKDSKGITIAARRGSEVKAVFEGKVTGVYALGQFGKCVTVRSGNYVVVYGNLAEAYLKSGDTVSLNQTLGALPDSDDENRRVLLFQIWHETTALDPEQWLRK